MQTLKNRIQASKNFYSMVNRSIDAKRPLSAKIAQINAIQQVFNNRFN